jgi:hypothetical protein
MKTNLMKSESTVTIFSRQLQPEDSTGLPTKQQVWQLRLGEGAIKYNRGCILNVRNVRVLAIAQSIFRPIFTCAWWRVTASAGQGCLYWYRCFIFHKWIRQRVLEYVRDIWPILKSKMTRNQNQYNLSKWAKEITNKITSTAWQKTI